MPSRLNRRRLVQAGAGISLAAVAAPIGTTLAQNAATPAASPAGASAGSLEGRVRPLIDPLMKDLMVPGAVVLVRSGGEEFFDAFGLREIGQPDAVTTDDHFRIGSNTKTMTGTLVLQLVQEGKMALTDPVAKYRPDVPNGEHITITQMLDMTSGLDTYSNDAQVNRYMDEEPWRVWDPEELVKIGLAKPPLFAPGEGFFYSNTNTILLGLIAEHLDGGQLSDLMQARIFDPLKMAHSVFPALDDVSLPEPYPHGYLYGTNVSTLATTALPLYRQKQAEAGTLLPSDVTWLNPSWMWAAGGTISTATDLATYVEALIGGGLLHADVQAERLASLKVPPGSTEPDAAKYGLALAEFGPFMGHDGSLPGYTSFMGHDPRTGNTLIVLTTLQSAPNGLMVANEFAKAIIPVL
ncbi:MAG: serine hydrolase domain-containing protein [Thermomicrobiales bacterium]